MPNPAPRSQGNVLSDTCPGATNAGHLLDVGQKPDGNREGIARIQLTRSPSQNAKPFSHSAVSGLRSNRLG
jgi:hypothetical protein